MSQRTLLTPVMAILAVACSKPAAERPTAESTASQAPRTISSLSGVVAGFRPARVVVCNPEIPYIGPIHGEITDGITPLMIPLWLPLDPKGESLTENCPAKPIAGKLSICPGNWIQFDLTVDWSKDNPLQISPKNLKLIQRKDIPEKCHGAIH